MIIVFLVGGCQSMPTNTASSTKPAWIDSPFRSGVISVVGYAPRQPDGNSASQYKVAILNARRELAQMVRVHIQNKVEQTVVDDNGAVSKSANIETRASSKAALRLTDAEVNAQWVDSVNGGLYLLLELPE
jgi:hypothetical protein